MCHELSAGGYRPVLPGTGASVLVIASELALPAGVYDATDGAPRAQRELADAIAAAAGRDLHR